MIDEGVPRMVGVWHYDSNNISGKWHMSNTPDFTADFSFSPQGPPELPADATCDTCNNRFLSHERHVTCWSCFNVCHTKCHTPNAGTGNNYTCQRCQSIQRKYIHSPPVHRSWTGYFRMHLPEGKRTKIADNLTLVFDYGQQDDDPQAIAKCTGSGVNAYGNFSVSGHLFLRHPNAYEVRFSKRYLLAPPLPAGSTETAAQSQTYSAPLQQQQQQQHARTGTPNSPPSPSQQQHMNNMMHHRSSISSNNNAAAAAAPLPTLHRTSKALNISKLDEDRDLKKRKLSQQQLQQPMFSPLPVLQTPPAPLPPPAPKPPTFTVVNFLECTSTDTTRCTVWILNHFRPVREWERLVCLSSPSMNLPISCILTVVGDADLLNEAASRASVSAACTAAQAVVDGSNNALALSIVPCGVKYNVDLICASYVSSQNITVGVFQLLSNTIPPPLGSSRAGSLARVNLISLVDSKATNESTAKSLQHLQQCDFIIVSIQTSIDVAAKLVTEMVLALGKRTVILVHDLSDTNLHLVLNVTALMQRSMTSARLPTKLNATTVLDVKVAPLQIAQQPTAIAAAAPPSQAVPPPVMSRQSSYASLPPANNSTAPPAGKNAPLFVPPVHSFGGQQQPQVSNNNKQQQQAVAPLPSPPFLPATNQQQVNRSSTVPPPQQPQQRYSNSALPQPKPSSSSSLPQPVSTLPQVKPPPPQTTSALPQPRQQQQQQQQPAPSALSSSSMIPSYARSSTYPSALPQPTPPSSSSLPQPISVVSQQHQQSVSLPQPLPSTKSQSSVPPHQMRQSAIPPPQTNALPRPVSSQQMQMNQQQMQQQQQQQQHAAVALLPPTSSAPKTSVVAPPQQLPPQQQQLPKPTSNPVPTLPQPTAYSQQQTLPQPKSAAAPPPQQRHPPPQQHSNMYASKKPRSMESSFEVPPILPTTTQPAPPTTVPVVPVATQPSAPPVVIVDDSPPPTTSAPAIAPQPPTATATVTPAPKKESDGWDDDEDDDNPDYSYLLT